jgi:hypothetical protein
MSDNPATFRLPAGNRFVGLLVYSVVLPFLAFVILSFIGAIGFALVEHGQFPETAVILTAGAISLLVLTWLVRFAIFDYRRRAGVAVTIGSDSLSIIGPRKSARIPDAASLLEGHRVVAVRSREETADLILEFEGGVYLEVLSDSSGYEPWNLCAPGIWLIGIGGGGVSDASASRPDATYPSGLSF